MEEELRKQLVELETLDSQDERQNEGARLMATLGQLSILDSEDEQVLKVL